MNRKSIQLKGLTLASHQQNLCQDLNITFLAGQIWGILGRNGSGKTTLLHTIAGLTKPSAGEIFINSNPIQLLPQYKIAQQIGLLFQQDHDVFDHTLLEVTLLARYPHFSGRIKGWNAETESDRNIALAALSIMELETMAHRRVKSLSGGERRRLGIAMVLAQTPQFYLLDEPINHLDLHYQVKTFRYFKELAYTQPATIIMALHDINMAYQFCDYIILLAENGHYYVGDKAILLNLTLLSDIYQCSIDMSQMNGRIFWHSF